MNRWLVWIIVVGLALAFVPLIVKGIAALTVRGVNAVSHEIESLLGPLSMTGDPRMQGLIELCLYLVAIVYIGKFLSRIR
jgi:hypothetical protein